MDRQLESILNLVKGGNNAKPLSRGTQDRLNNLTRDEILKIDPIFPTGILTLYSGIDISVFYQIAKRYGLSDFVILGRLRGRINYSEWFNRIPLEDKEIPRLISDYFPIKILADESNTRYFENFKFLVDKINSNLPLEISKLIAEFIEPNEHMADYYILKIIKVMERAEITRIDLYFNLPLIDKLDKLANASNEERKKLWFKQVLKK